MGKTLSICVPSYNMEKYIRRNIESFLDSGCLNDLELIVVNDGSKDSTLSIAREYEALYPQTIVVIDKNNGHYGSCINAALKIATGKYFRIVDADDWVNTESLRSFISLLRDNDADCFITKYSTYSELSGKTHSMDMNASIMGRTLKIDEIEINPSFLHMHCITWRKEHLMSIHYSQTEGICYTDLEYGCLPMLSARTIYFTDLVLYQYFIGRQDQSVAPGVVAKNFDQFVTVYNRLKNYTYVSMNTKTDQIKKCYYQTLLGFMMPTHIFHDYRNREHDSFLRGEVTLLLMKGYVFSDFLFPVDRKMTKYVKSWYNGGVFDKLILFIQRCRTRKL